MGRLTRDGTAETVSRDQILRHTRGQGNAHFPCSADHEQGWQPYPVDPYSAICDDHTYIHKTIIVYYYYQVLSNHIPSTTTVHCFWLLFLVVVCTIIQCFCLLKFFWCPCMAINNVSVQYNGGLLPDIILLMTQCYYHRRTRVNVIKMFCLCSL